MLKALHRIRHLDTGWLDTFFLLIVIGSLYFILLGNRPLFVPDEGRYAEIAREMVANNDYITPYLNGIKYFEKPVLFYWLQSGAIKLAGLTLFSLRMVNALLGVLGCLLTYFVARQRYGRLTGLLAALILGTSLLYFVMAHMISLDLPVTVTLSATLYAVLLGSQQPLGLNRRLYFLAAAAAAALAVLTKGLIGIVFPVMIVGLWLTLLGELRTLRHYYLGSSLLLFLLIAAPWHVLVQWRNPEFFYFYFIEQHFLRYTTKEIGHYQPVWFFIPTLILGFFPWIVFLPQAIVKAWSWTFKERHHYRHELFFLIWAFTIFLFFSFSKSKLIPYILPLFPPLAILTARYLTTCLKQNSARGILIGDGFLIAFAVLISFTFYHFLQTTLFVNIYAAKMYLTLAASLLLIGALIAFFYAFKSLAKSLCIIFVTTWLFLLLIIAAVPAIDTRSIRPLALQLKPLLKANDVVVTFNQYYQDLPFYLERRVSILNWRNELTFGMQQQDTHAWMLNDTQFWQAWHSKQRVFVIMSKEQYQELKHHHRQENFSVLGATINNVLLVNHRYHE